MTKLDHDPLIAAFDEFRSQAATLVRPAGIDRTRETLRIRNRNRNVALAALSVLVIAISVTAGAVLTTDPHRTPSDLPTADPHASGAPYFVGPGETTHPSGKAPEGGITEVALYSAELDVPPWPAENSNANCGSGPVRFQAGDASLDASTVWIAGVYYADVDRDNRAETFARIFCWSDNDIVSQVVAFTPASGGRVRTIGPVLAQTGDTLSICSVRAGASGTVQVEIADFPVPWRCADPTSADERYVTRQWLTFTWSGSAFVEQGTSEHTTNPYATDLKLTSTDLVLTKRANGHYTGSMTLTVHNNGTSAIPYKTLTLLQHGMRLVDRPGGCTASATGGGMDEVRCIAAKLTGGATRTITLKVDSPRRYEIRFEPSTDVISLKGYNDPNDTNNAAAYAIKFRG